MPAAVPGSTKRARVITGNKRSLSCSDSDSATEQNGFGPLSLLDPLINEMDKQLPPFVYDPRPPDPEAKPEDLSEKHGSKIWCRFGDE